MPSPDELARLEREAAEAAAQIGSPVRLLEDLLSHDLDLLGQVLGYTPDPAVVAAARVLLARQSTGRG